MTPADAALQLMPMHLMVDATGTILSAGSTLRQIIGGATSFAVAFDPIVLPGQGAAPAQLAQAERVFLRLRDLPTRVLRGRALAVDGGAVLFSLGFGIGLAEAVRDYELTDRDFAPADLAMELLFLHEANNAMTDELSRANLRLEEARSKAEAQAFTDPLTGLYNRRGLELGFEPLRQGALHTPPMHFAVVLMDLDHFKELNDGHGHAAGDEMLRQVAVRLHAITRDEDTVARTGGDEFVLLLPHLDDAARLESLGRRIVDSIERPVQIAGKECRISTSLGAAISSDFPGVTWADMQAAADAALYEAKRSGRRCLRIAPPGQVRPMDEPASANTCHQAELRRMT